MIPRVISAPQFLTVARPASLYFFASATTVMPRVISTAATAATTEAQNSFFPLPSSLPFSSHLPTPVVTIPPSTTPQPQTEGRRGSSRSTPFFLSLYYRQWRFLHLLLHAMWPFRSCVGREGGGQKNPFVSAWRNKGDDDRRRWVLRQQQGAFAMQSCRNKNRTGNKRGSP